MIMQLGLRPNNSFKPNLLRYTKAMAEKACHGFASTTQVGLTQALGRIEADRNLTSKSSNQKIGPLWRVVAAVIALVIGGYEIVGYNVARSINLNYFNDPSVPISVLDVVGVLVSLYLLAIAVSGHWRFHRKGS